MAKVAYIIELTIQEGKTEEFTEQASAYVTAVNDDEPGTLEYQWWISEDGERCLLKETFDASSSLMTHLGNVGPTLPNLLAIAPITRKPQLETSSAAACPAPSDHSCHCAASIIEILQKYTLNDLIEFGESDAVPGVACRPAWKRPVRITEKPTGTGSI